MPVKAALFLSGVALISFTGYLVHKYPDFFTNKSCSSEYIHKLREQYQIQDFQHKRNSLNETELYFFVTENDPYFRIEDNNDFNVLFEFNNKSQTAKIFLKNELCESLDKVRFSKNDYTKLSATLKNDGTLIVTLVGENLKKTLSCRVGERKLSEEAVLTIGYKNSNRLEKYFYDCPRKTAAPWRFISSTYNGVTIRRSGPFGEVSITKKVDCKEEIKKKFSKFFENLFFDGMEDKLASIDKKDGESTDVNKDFNKDDVEKEITINRGKINISKNDKGVQVDKDIRGSFGNINISKNDEGVQVNKDIRGPFENINISKNDEGVQVEKDIREHAGNINTLKNDVQEDININRGPFGEINISKNDDGVQMDKDIRGPFGNINISKNDGGVQVDKDIRGPFGNINISKNDVGKDINISKNDEGVQVDKDIRGPFGNINISKNDVGKNININRGPFGEINISKNDEGVQVDKDIQGPFGNINISKNDVKKDININGEPFGKLNISKNDVEKDININRGPFG